MKLLLMAVATIAIGILIGATFTNTRTYEPVMCPTHAETFDELAQLQSDYKTLVWELENVERMKRVNKTGYVAEVEFIIPPSKTLVLRG